MEDFRQEILIDFNHIVINGYFPSLTIKSVSIYLRIIHSGFQSYVELNLIY